MAGQESDEESTVSESAEGNSDSDAPQQEATGSAAEQVRQDNRRQRRAAAARRRQRRQRELDEAKAVGLDAGEMVDEALVRSGDRVTKWLVRNFRHLQWVFVAAVLFWAGSTGLRLYKAGKHADASDQLIGGPEALGGVVLGAEETQIPLGDEQVAKFASSEEQLEASDTAYQQAAGMLEGSGVEAFALLGQAAIRLDQAKYAEAKALYERVVALEVATQTPELTGRAHEGIAMSLEGSGDTAGALEAYRALERLQLEGFVALAKFEQARLQSQSDPTQALQLLDAVLSESAALPPPGPLSVPRYTERRARELRATLLATRPELVPQAAADPALPPALGNVPPAPPGAAP